MALPDGNFNGNSKSDWFGGALERRRSHEAEAAADHDTKLREGLGYIGVIDEVLGEAVETAEVESVTATHQPHPEVQRVDHLLEEIDTLLASTAA